MNEEDVRQIREEYVDRKEAWKSPNVIELAQRYGVSQETIRKIAKGHNYKWVQ
jgi:DeoR/GlpR family transcriptional regulator of sugar metabolism